MPREIRPPFPTVNMRPPHPATVQARLRPHPATTAHGTVATSRRPLTLQRAEPADPLSKEFQALIDGLGAPNVLEGFASFLGREDFDFAKGSGRTRQVAIAKDFTGLAFDGAHWKGYEKGVVTYDSYSAKVQLPKTNNFCQSYACFMWASKGLVNKTHGVELVAGQYGPNVVKMSALWLAYFKHMASFKKGAEWLDDACPGWKGISLTLGKLSSDEKLARNFSTSAE